MAKKTSRMPISVAVDGQTGTSDKISQNWGVHQGTVIFAKIIIPAYTNNVTTNIYIVDSDGDRIYPFLALAKGATHIVSDLQIPLVSEEYFEAELSGVPGGLTAYTIYVTLYYVSDYK